jgi:GcrA cell cycle regulator
VNVPPPESGGPGTWDERTVRRLRTLHAAGHSMAEIGRRLGFGKNSIVSKAHRLGLSARPSPIHRVFDPDTASAKSLRQHRYRQRREALGLPARGPGHIPRAAPASVHTIPPLPSLAPIAAPRGDFGWRVEPLPPAAPARPKAAAAPGRVPVQHVREPPPAPRYGRITECAWPLDHPTNPRRFLACDAPTVPGRPYCPVHAEQAYQRVRDRREDAWR